MEKCNRTGRGRTRASRNHPITNVHRTACRRYKRGGLLSTRKHSAARPGRTCLSHSFPSPPAMAPGPGADIPGVLPAFGQSPKIRFSNPQNRPNASPHVFSSSSAGGLGTSAGAFRWTSLRRWQSTRLPGRRGSLRGRPAFSQTHHTAVDRRTRSGCGGDTRHR